MWSVDNDGIGRGRSSYYSGSTIGIFREEGDEGDGPLADPGDCGGIPLSEPLKNRKSKNACLLDRESMKKRARANLVRIWGGEKGDDDADVMEGGKKLFGIRESSSGDGNANLWVHSGGDVYDIWGEEVDGGERLRSDGRNGAISGCLSGHDVRNGRLGSKLFASTKIPSSVSYNPSVEECREYVEPKCFQFKFNERNDDEVMEAGFSFEEEECTPKSCQQFKKPTPLKNRVQRNREKALKALELKKKKEQLEEKKRLDYLRLDEYVKEMDDRGGRKLRCRRRLKKCRLLSGAVLKAYKDVYEVGSNTPVSLRALRVVVPDVARIGV